MVTYLSSALTLLAAALIATSADVNRGTRFVEPRPNQTQLVLLPVNIVRSWKLRTFACINVHDTSSKCVEIYVEIGNIVAMMILRDGDGWMSIERVVRGKIESCGGDISATGKKEGLPRRGWRGDTDKG